MKRITVDLEDELFEHLRKEAFDRREHMSVLVRSAIEQYLSAARPYTVPPPWTAAPGPPPESGGGGLPGGDILVTCRPDLAKARLSPSP